MKTIKFSDMIELPNILKYLKSFQRFVIFILLSVLTAITLYPIIFIVFGVALVYRQLVQSLVNSREPKCGPLITGMNALFAAEDPYGKPIVNICPYITFTEKIDRRHIIKVINEQVIKPNLYPELKQQIVRKFGYYFWYPVENFDVEHHIKYLHPESPEMPVTKRELRQLGFDQIPKIPYDSRLSPWDMYLVPNLVDETNPAVKSAIFVRSNHCLMDGYSIISFIQKCASKPWNIPVSQKYLNTNRNKGFKEKIQEFLQIFKLLVTAPYHALSFFCLSNEKSDFIEKALTPTTTEDEKWMVKETEPRRIPENRLKRLKSKLSVSMSSLLVTIATGGVIRYIRLKWNKKFSELPDHIYIQMAFPVPGHPDKLTNHWSTVRFPIKVSAKDNPMEVLERIHRKFEYYKGSIAPLVVFLATKLFGLLPARFFISVDKLPVQTILLTNIPGAVETPDMFGYKSDCFGLAGSPARGSAFVVGVQNFLGKFWIDIGGTGTLLKSQEDMIQVEDFAHSVLDELEHYAIKADRHFGIQFTGTTRQTKQE